MTTRCLCRETTFSHQIPRFTSNTLVTDWHTFVFVFRSRIRKPWKVFSIQCRSIISHRFRNFLLILVRSLPPTMATPVENNKIEPENSDSDTDFLSDVEEVDHMKILSSSGADQLQFVDTYFQREATSLLADTTDYYNSTCDDSSLNTSLLPWERLADWIHCFCVVTFDLEIGQMIEVRKEFVP